MDSWINMLFGLVQVALLLAGIYLTVSQFRRVRASSYIERFNSRDMQESRADVDRWLRDHPDPLSRLQALEADPALAASVKRFANLFQELGAAYQFRVAHRATVRTVFDSLVVMYWERLRFWVAHYRATTNPTLYARFEFLHREMLRRARSGRAETVYVVAYGSLLDPASASRAIGRPVSRDDLIPVEVHGFRRVWNLGEEVTLRESGARCMAAFLNVVPEEGSRVRAAMLAVTPAELDRLRRRERHYDVLEVTDATRLTGGSPVHSGGRVLLFRGMPEHLVDPADPEVRVLTRYAARVENAAQALAPAMATEIRESLVEVTMPREDGDYRFVDPGQAQLV